MFANTKIDRKNSRPTHWRATGLEQRLMLAADAGAAIGAASVTPVEAACETGVEGSNDNASSTSSRIVFIDPSIEDADLLAAAVSDGSEIVLIDAADPIGQITKVLSHRQDVRQISVVSHGTNGELKLGEATIDSATLENRAGEIRQWSQSLTEDADLLLFGCNLASGQVGKNMVARFAELTGADVAASIDRTGNLASGADWELEFTLGHVDDTRVFCDARVRKFEHTLNIVVHAWGATGDEQIELLIDDNVVETFDLKTTHQGFFHQTDESITADRVKVRFANDAYLPNQNYDRNATVESIQIDGQFYESEDVSTLSTGTYRTEDGLRTGFGRGEILHANGYFDYGTDVPRGGSRLEIVARGQTGEERFELTVGTDLIGDYDVTTGDQTFVYETETPIQPGDVRIRFLNDFYVPGGQDNNLIVDKIRIDGVAFETEAPDVFSTGTWEPGGVVAGIKNSETLHANGYFQYGFHPDNAGSIVPDESFGIGGVIEFPESARLIELQSAATADRFVVTDGNTITPVIPNTFFGDNGSYVVPFEDVTILDVVQSARTDAATVLTRARLTLDGYQLHRFDDAGRYVSSVTVDDLGAGTLTTFGGGPKLASVSGGLILAGNKQNTDTTAFIALNTDLTLNTAFGNGGIAEHSGITSSFSSVSDIVGTNDGGFIAYTSFQNSENPTQGLVLHKFDASGQVDSSFGNNGISEPLTFVNFASGIQDVKIDLNGRFVGYNRSGYFRWTENGFLDDSFGGDGEVEVELAPVTLVDGNIATLRSGQFGIAENGDLIVSQSLFRSNVSSPPTELGMLYGQVFEDGSSNTNLGAVFFAASEGNAIQGRIVVGDDGTFTVYGSKLGGSFTVNPAVGRFIIG